jgi:hypothetical protein
MLVVTNCFVVFGAGFGGDGLAHGVDELGVPCGGHADDLREIGGVSGEGDAVEAFVPPEILRDAEARDGGGVIAHLLDFFFEGHLGDEGVDALIDGEGCVEPGLVCLLGGGVGWDEEDGGKKCERGKERASAGHGRLRLLVKRFCKRSDSIGREGWVVYRFVVRLAFDL